jgi:tight adherence protein C
VADLARFDPIAFGAAAFIALSFAGLVSSLVPVPARLRDRVDPYTRPATARPGLPLPVGRREKTRSLSGAARDITLLVGKAVEGSTDAGLARKLHQAGVLSGVAAELRPTTYRTRVALTAAASGAVSLGVAIAFRRSGGIALAFAALGFVAGAAFWRGRLDRAIEKRRVRMRIELYTINQVLAMEIRVGKGVMTSVRRLAERGRGEVVRELRDVLRLHRGGLAAAEALRRTASRSPEPHARRTYRALATAEERGSDVAGALLAMSEDIRDGRREAIRRRATRRRALMLLPIVGLLAPILILFVAAPLPWLVLRGFG